MSETALEDNSQLNSEPTSVNDEIAAMRKLVNALDSLDTATQRRVLQWLTARYAAVTARDYPG